MIENVLGEIGKVRDDNIFKIITNGKLIIEEGIPKLKEAWQKPFKNF